MKRGETFIPDNFLLTQATLSWMTEKAPTVDIPETLAIFTDKALAKGWIYRDWQAAFRNYIRNASKFGGAVYKTGVEDDPRWRAILAQARQYGFRAPQGHESPRGYETAFEDWRQAQKRAPVVLQLPIKRIDAR